MTQQKEIKDKDFAQVCNDMVELHERKNADYGNAFHEAYKKIGNGYALGLLYNKVNRLITLLSSDHTQQVKDESVSDTLLDLANYAVMTKVEIDNEQRERYEQSRIFFKPER